MCGFRGMCGKKWHFLCVLCRDISCSWNTIHLSFCPYCLGRPDTSFFSNQVAWLGLGLFRSVLRQGWLRKMLMQILFVLLMVWTECWVSSAAVWQRMQCLGHPVIHMLGKINYLIWQTSFYLVKTGYHCPQSLITHSKNSLKGRGS